MNDTKGPKTGENSPDNPRSWGQAGDVSRKDPHRQARLIGRGGGGDSAGGAYPNPHSGKEGEGGREGYMGHGGQTEMPYHGSGRLGEQDAGGNPNSATEKTGDD